MSLQDNLLSSLILAIIQGITEWLPISSSGHLVLFENLLDYAGGLVFESAVHFGTLMAVFIYFRQDIMDILRDFLSGSINSENGKMIPLLTIASIPAAIVGFFAKDIFSLLSHLQIISLGFAITGILLIITSKWKTKSHKLNWKIAFLIGMAQIFALIPGISRSGSTIATGVLLGLDEKKAMKFSFLMAIPIILGANFLILNNSTLNLQFLWASLVAFIVGLASIHLVFKYFLTKRKNFKWFGIYCLILSIIILITQLI